MSVIESVYVALFLMAIVFAGLLGLYLSIKLFSYLFISAEKAKSRRGEAAQEK